jgi:hypothetical protein
MNNHRQEARSPRLIRAQEMLESLRLARQLSVGGGPPFAAPAEELAAAVEVQCLFPALSPTGQRLLIILGWQNQMLAKLVNLDRDRINPTIRRHWDAATDEIERHYMDLVALVKSEVEFQRWSEADRQVFQEKYLSIPFEVTSSHRN